MVTYYTLCAREICPLQLVDVFDSIKQHKHCKVYLIPVIPLLASWKNELLKALEESSEETPHNLYGQSIDLKVKHGWNNNLAMDRKFVVVDSVNTQRLRTLNDHTLPTKVRDSANG